MDAEKMQQLGRDLANKSVLSALKAAIIVVDTVEGKSLCDEVDNCITVPYCGYMSMSFDPAETLMTLNLCLNMVPRDYKLTVSIPSNDYVSDLYNKYDMLKQVAVAYWHTFMEENPELLEKIKAYRPDVEWTKLNVDPVNNTTLYWDPQSPQRIGIFAYYKDPSGKIYYKN